MSSFRKNFAISVLLAGFVATESLAQGNPDDAPEKTEADVIDEITVLGPRSLAALRRDINDAEDEVFVIFNSLNTDDDYDIICKKETRVGSQILYRVCKAKIYRDKRSAAAEDFYDEGAPQGVNLNAKEHSKILREKMRALAMQNPQLVDALKKRQTLQKEFELQREHKFQ